jgi:L-2-hydroxyglutarate oxidase LhgO
MTDSRCDVLIAGGGIVGLAVALEITRRFPRLRLLLLEKEDRVGRHQSGHNSGVIHSGVYYKPGSLKAALCLEGARAMIDFCRAHGLPHEVCGKVIVATRKEEFPRLEELRRRGEANGLSGIRLIDAGELREIEPHASGLRALAVPSTGITDYAAVCEKYAELIRKQGGAILTSTAVTGLRELTGEVIVETGSAEFSATYLINCAGLFSDRVARMAGGEPDVMIVPFRGEYYHLIPQRSSLVKALIYPVPDPQFPFLGVHFTRRISGTVDAGPNAVLAFRREGYRLPLWHSRVSGKWLRSIGAVVCMNFTTRSPRAHLSAPCNGCCRKFARKIYFLVALECARRPSAATAPWWMIFCLPLKEECCTF